MSENADLMWTRIKFAVALCEACVEVRGPTWDTQPGAEPHVDRCRMLVAGLYYSSQIEEADRVKVLVAANRLAPTCMHCWEEWWPETYPVK